MERFAQKHPERAIDVLNERLVFERAAVKLYDRLLAALDMSDDENMLRTRGDLRQHRNEEKEHEEWLEEQIRALGGDAHAQTEHSELVLWESKGIEEVLEADPKLSHLFHALLAAELVDNAGWDLLAQLADEAGDRPAKRAFKKRLHEEEEHLLFIRKVVENLSIEEVLGEQKKMPASDLAAAAP